MTYSPPQMALLLTLSHGRIQPRNLEMHKCSDYGIIKEEILEFPRVLSLNTFPQISGAEAGTGKAK